MSRNRKNLSALLERMYFEEKMTVIVFVVLVLSGHPPVNNFREVGSLEECMNEVSFILKNEPPANGSLQAGCVLVGAKTSGT